MFRMLAVDFPDMSLKLALAGAWKAGALSKLEYNWKIPPPFWAGFLLLSNPCLSNGTRVCGKPEFAFVTFFFSVFFFVFLGEDFDLLVLGVGEFFSLIIDWIDLALLTLLSFDDDPPWYKGMLTDVIPRDKLNDAG